MVVVHLSILGSTNNLLIQVFKHYFEELEEESLRDNFVVVVRSLCFLPCPINYGYLNPLLFID